MPCGSPSACWNMAIGAIGRRLLCIMAKPASHTSSSASVRSIHGLLPSVRLGSKSPQLISDAPIPRRSRSCWIYTVASIPCATASWSFGALHGLTMRKTNRIPNHSLIFHGRQSKPGSARLWHLSSEEPQCLPPAQRDALMHRHIPCCLTWGGVTMKEWEWYHANFNTPDDLALCPAELDGGVDRP